MAPIVDTFDLSTMHLSSGEGGHLDATVAMDPLDFGGQTYRVPEGQADVRLDVSRTTGGGYSLRLRFDTHLDGPCMRCLDEADPEIEVDAREIDQPDGGDELSSPYLTDSSLDLGDWAHDALSLALPTQILCKPDCAGLCPKCGANLNQDPDHEHEPEPDPRWAKLSELKLEE